MKSILSVAGMAGLVLGVALETQAQQGGIPRLVLSQSSWDFGHVWQEEQPAFNLQLRNEGTGVIKIAEVRSG